MNQDNSILFEDLGKLQFSETTHFLKSTQTALESSKFDIFQK